MAPSGAALTALLAACLALALHVGWLLPRLGWRAAAAVAVGVIAASGVAATEIAWWWATPALALVFAHLGQWAERRRRQPERTSSGGATPPAARAPSRDGPPRRAQPPGAAAAVSTTRAADAAPERGAAAPAAPGPLRAKLGRYVLEREIGRGAMGAVYLGRDAQIGRPVAIKTLALTREFEGAALAEARQRFFREAETAGRLQHPDIVTIFDAGEDQDLAYIAMEFVAGHDLLPHTLPGRLLPPAQCVDIVARVAAALAHAHRQGVVHRDIKPANVMVDVASGSVKVTDFGIARLSDASRTRTGMVLGTPSFMSPEQMAGLRVDGRSDLYSLGVMLFQLLTGVLPHRSESMARLMFLIANEDAPDIRSVRPELPEALANIVALALERRPEVRYADGDQMAGDLRQVAGLLDQRSAVEPAPTGPTAGLPAPSDRPDAAAAADLARAEARHNSSPPILP